MSELENELRRVIIQIIVRYPDGWERVLAGLNEVLAVAKEIWDEDEEKEEMLGH